MPQYAYNSAVPAGSAVKTEAGVLQRPLARSRRLVRRCVRGALVAVAIAAVAALAGGCTSAALSAAREHLAAGRYAAAHADLLAAKKADHLSASQRREVADGLCLTEFHLGGPQYALAEQYRACAAAAVLPGSDSGTRLGQIEQAQRERRRAQVETALAHHDLARAQEAALRYSATPGADPALLRAWSARIWKMVYRDDALVGGKRRKRMVKPAIAAMEKRYPRLRSQSAAGFESWARHVADDNGAPLVAGLTLHGPTLDLWINDDNLERVALSLDRLVRVNDGLAARCGCDAQTNVGVRQTGLPVYVVRLDPATRGSEVLILPRP